MEPKTDIQDKEALLEYVGCLNTLELAWAIHNKNSALRQTARNLLSRIKYTTNYHCMKRVIQSPLPDAEVKTLWKPINDNGGVHVVLEYEQEVKQHTAKLH
jgi:hypothetical protein